MTPAFSMRPWRKEVLRHSILLSILVPLVVFVVLTSVPFGVFGTLSDLSILDFAYQLRGEQRANPLIVLVSIGTVPAPRGDIATALNIVKRFRPAAIGIDVLLDRADSSRTDAGLREALRGDVPIVLPSVIGKTKVRPHPSFLHPNVHLGFVDLNLMGDSVIRRFYAAREVDGQVFQSFASQLATLSGNPAGDEFPGAQDYQINYAGDYGRFLNFDLSDILAYEDISTENEDVASMFRGKVLLFGYFFISGRSEDRYPVLTDIYLTPLSPLLAQALKNSGMYGVVVHANILNTLIGHRKIIEVGGGFWELGASFVLIFANVMGRYSFTRLSPRKRRSIFTAALLIEVATLLIIPVLLFLFSDIHVRLSVPLISLIILPRAEGWYYRYADNVAIPFRRFSFRKFPEFILRPYLAVFESSSLRDRLGAVLNVGSILVRFTEFLFLVEAGGGPRKGVPAARPWREDEKLNGSVLRLKSDLRHFVPLMYLHQKIRELGKECSLVDRALETELSDGGFSDDSTSVLKHFTNTSLLMFPVREHDVRYENYFLGLVSAVNEVIRRLRPYTTGMECGFTGSTGHNGEMGPGGFADGSLDGGPVRLHCRDGSEYSLSPFVVVRRCQVHLREEYFVLNGTWRAESNVQIHEINYLGPQPGCFFVVDDESCAGSNVMTKERGNEHA